MQYNIYLYDLPGLGAWYIKSEILKAIQDDGRKYYYDKECTKLVTI